MNKKKLAALFWSINLFLLIAFFYFGNRARLVSEIGQGRSPASQMSPYFKVRVEATASDKINPFRRKVILGNHMLLSQEEPLSSDEELVAVLDNDCAQNSLGRVSADIRDLRYKRHPGLKQQAYAYKTNLSVGNLAEAANQDPCVVSISRNGTVHTVGTPNDPNYPSQLQMTGINAAASFDTFFPSAGGGITSDIVIAIIDTGIDNTHPDLNANLWNDGSGHFGYNFIAGNSTPIDDDGHGSFVAGEIGASCGNGLGICGVTGFRTKLMAVKVLDSTGSGSFVNIINGINWATAHGAKVINMSLGGTSQSTAIQTAIQNAVNAGVFVAAAAGNSNLLLSGSSWFSPGSYASGINGFMCVGSIDSVTQDRSYFSNYSTGYVEIGAPGSNGIFSTTKGGGYGTMQGTSMATPLVAGAGALVFGITKSRGYSVTPAQVEQLIYNSGLSVASLSSYFKGGKILDLASLAATLNAQYPLGGIAPSTTTTTTTTTTIVPSKPNTPSKFRVTSMSAGSLSFAWTSGGGTTSGFYLNIVKGTVTPSCGLGKNIGNVTSYHVTGLNRRTTYTASLCAYNSMGALSGQLSTRAATTLSIFGSSQR